LPANWGEYLFFTPAGPRAAMPRCIGTTVEAMSGPWARLAPLGRVGGVRSAHVPFSGSSRIGGTLWRSHHGSDRQQLGVATGLRETDRRTLTRGSKGSPSSRLAEGQSQSCKASRVSRAWWVLGSSSWRHARHRPPRRGTPAGNRDPLRCLRAGGAFGLVRWLSGGPYGWAASSPTRSQIDQQGFSSQPGTEKYEHHRQSARSFWLKVPARGGQLISCRQGLALTDEVAA